MLPAALAGIFQMAATSGVPAAVQQTASSVLFPQINSLGLLRTQSDWQKHSIILPSPEALIGAWNRGWYEWDSNGKAIPRGLQTFITAMRRNGVARGEEGYLELSKSEIDFYLDSWEAVMRSAAVKPGIKDAFMGWISGMITKDEFDTMLMRNGADFMDWAWLKPLYSNRLDVGELLENHRRGFVDRKQFDDYMKILQYGIPGDTENIRRLTEVIPGYQDIVRFVIREAFNPQQVIDLELGAELDQNPAYLKWAKATGLGEVTIKDDKGNLLTEDMAKLYWYAHWELPSPTQSYQFLHFFYPESRYGPSPLVKKVGKFDEKDINSLLKAADYAPKWRKFLAGVSFHPFNRIDVRRVRKAGLIKKEDVYHNYRRSGYADFEANAMTEYVEQEIKKGNKEKHMIKFKDRTCKSYGIGLIDKTQLKQRLEQAGYPKEDATFETDLCDMDKANNFAFDVVNSIKMGFLSGAFTVQEVEKELLAIGMKGAKISEYLHLWDLKLRARRRIVAAGEVSKWFVDRLISQDEFISRLTKLSYNPADVTRIVAAAILDSSRRIARAQKVSMLENQRAIEKQLRDTEKRRYMLERQERDRIRKQKDIQQARDKVENLRLQRFLTSRTIWNLRDWLKDSQLSKDEVRESLMVRGYSLADANRWIITSLQKGK